MPEEGEEPAALLADWRDTVVPFSTALGSPRHFAFVDGSGAMIGILAEALAAATNTNAGAWKLGPGGGGDGAAGAALDRPLRRLPGRHGRDPRLRRHDRELHRLADRAPPPLPTTARPAACRTARAPGRFLLYMSDHEGHVSVVRAADMLNLGRDAVRRVPSRSDFTMDPDALDRMVAEDRARGDVPFCVVAQLGSVNVGAVDPLDALADVCARHGLWLHGDGAIGLLAAGLPELHPLFAGLERADSVSCDAHKWLGVPHDCGVLLVRDGERLRRAFSIARPISAGTSTTARGRSTTSNTGRRCPAPSARSRSGWRCASSARTASAALLGKNIGLARGLHALVHDHPDFEVLRAPTLPSTASAASPTHSSTARTSPRSRSGSTSSTRRSPRAVQASGLAFL